MKLERVQILRFMAAAGVLAFHTNGTLANHIPDPGTLWPLRYGYCGVDLFFVISGFIIHLTVRSRERDWGLFIRRRVFRVVPLYWACTLAIFALVPLVSQGASPSAGALFRSLMFLGWTGGPGAMPVLYLGWTLEYEILFYGLAAIAVALSPRPWRIVCPVLAALVFVGVLSRLDGPTRIPHFFLNPMLLEFAFGLLIGEGLARRRIPWLELVPVAVVTLLVVRFEWGERVGFAGVPAAALVLGAAALDAHRPLRGSIGRAFARLGDASYSIYLSQVFTISALVRIGSMGARYGSFELIAAGVALAGLAAGWLLYRVVEHPLQRYFRRFSRAAE